MVQEEKEEGKLLEGGVEYETWFGFDSVNETRRANCWLLTETKWTLNGPAVVQI